MVAYVSAQTFRRRRELLSKFHLDLLHSFPRSPETIFTFYTITHNLNAFRSTSRVAQIFWSKNQRAISIATNTLAVISRLERVPSLRFSVVYLITGDNQTFTTSHLQHRYLLLSIHVHPDKAFHSHLQDTKTCVMDNLNRPFGILKAQFH